jgi:hypothetical protein
VFRERHVNLHRLFRRPPHDQGHPTPEDPARPVTRSPEFNLRVFDQGERWSDISGHVHPISAMDPLDRQDLADWLWRNQNYFYFRVLARDLVSSLRISPGHPPPISSQWPGEWLSGTSLYQALRREPDDKSP